MSAIGSGISPTPSSGGGAGPDPFASLNSEEFFKIILTELQSQDPLSPQDTGAMLEQLSAIRNIESQTALQDQISAIVGQNQMAVAGGLLGKQIEGLDTGFNNTSGVVQAVRLEGEDVLLELNNGRRVSMDRVTRIDTAPSTGAGN